jgi:hypothetical protein
MNRYLPNTKPPEIPSDTCPYINFIQEILDQIKDKTKSKSIDAQIQLINDTLEYIRDSNSELRECGKYWKKQFENKGKKK